MTRSVLVCGAGLMGHGIAQVMAAAGHKVSLYEPEVARAEAGRARIGANLERAVAKGKHHCRRPAAAARPHRCGGVAGRCRPRR